jgi:hypothetical protein
VHVAASGDGDICRCHGMLWKPWRSKNGGLASHLWQRKKKHAIFYPFMEGMGGCNATTLRQEPRFLLHDKMEETRQDFPSIASQTLWKA